MMPRYFFHQASPPEPYDDPEGTELPDDVASLAYARTSAREWLADGIRDGFDYRFLSFRIVDETGREVALMPFNEALGSA